LILNQPEDRPRLPFLHFHYNPSAFSSLKAIFYTLFMATITIDPLTRVEGHLAIKTEITANKVTAAFVSGEMFRGFETILRGRDPLDAQHITQRVCGVCSVEHGVASVLAQDMAFNLVPSDNGRLMRNLMQSANFIASAISHFYLLSALDFIDVTAVVAYSGKDTAMLELQAWVKNELATRKVGPAAPFLPRYASQYSTDKDLNLGALRNYLHALEMRTMAHKVGSLFSGKLPHAATLIPGGVTEKVDALKIETASELLKRISLFVEGSYLPDVIAVAQSFPDYFKTGKGPNNFLAYGVFPGSSAGGYKLFPGGVVIDGKFEALDVAKISEDVGSSLFSSPSGLKPADGQTVPAPNKSGAYSWLKAPRYNGHPVEVGPLARTMVALLGNESPTLNRQINAFLGQLKLEPKDLNSAMGRHSVRALECKIVINECQEWLNQLQPDKASFTDFQKPNSGKGVGLTEASRGALGHWIEIRDGKIANYQLVVPTTWNASPRDDRGNPGPIEQALVGTAVADPTNPIEVARVVRSFDPCLACAVH
jgi:Ni,Fe-hydrogenase I large subunit